MRARARVLFCWTFLCSLVTAAVAAPAAAPLDKAAEQPSYVREVELSIPLAGPSIVAVDADQSVWVSLAKAGKILRITGDGQQQAYSLPPGSFPVGLLVEPEGNVWFTDIRKNQIVRLAPATGELRHYDVPTADSWPFFLVRDPNGNLYFTERVGNKVGRLDPRTGSVQEFPILTPHAQPAGMTITPDGQLFFTQNSSNKVGHFDPATGRMEDLNVPSPATPGPHYGPAGIASDAEGNVWFAELDGRLGLIRRNDRSRIEEFPLPVPRVRPGGIALDRWGFVWFTGLDGNVIGSFNPAHRVFRSYAVPSGAPDSGPMSPPEVSARGELPKAGMQAKSTRPFGIAVDGKGRVWFSEQYGHRIGYVTPPSIDAVSPAGMLDTPLVEIRTARRNLDDGWRVRYALDGQQVPLQDQLDLTRLTPGRHRWEVVADREGESAMRSATDFVIAPSLEFVERSVDSFVRNGTASSEATQHVRLEMLSVRGYVRDGRVDLARQSLREALRVLEGEESDGATSRLMQQLRYVELFGRLEPEVEVGAHGCSPTKVTVEVGDAVRWRNTATEAARLTAKDGSFFSPSLAADPWSRRFDQEGKIDYVCGSSAATIVVAPRKADVREIAMRGPGRVPTVLAIDNDKNLWFAAGGGGYASLASVPLNNIVGRLSPDGVITEFSTPTPESAPTSIKIAPDGTIWFTERAGNKIGRLDPQTGEITEFDIPSASAAPTGIAVARDGTVWFTEKMASKIGRFDPKAQKFTEYPTPNPNAEPSTVVVDAQGNIWFDERGADTINRMNPGTGEITSFKVTTQGSRVIGLVPDARGYMWFLELAGHKVGRLDVGTGQIVEYSIPTKFASPFKAALDRHGRLWFTEAYGNKVGVLDGERFFEYALPREGGMPGGIEVTSEGNIWFTQQAADVVGYIPMAGEIFVPSDDDPDREASALR
jgi:virginiamycin B lyase